MALHLLKGQQAERLARRHLERHGLRTLASNYRCHRGEIDLIMNDRATLVFVEVRYRKNQTFGSACESVTRSKQRKLLASAQFYLQQHPTDAPCRFDIIGITGDNAGARIEWLKDAFQAN